MSDDHAVQAISAYGSHIIQTPNIDRIAKEGIRFDNCFCTNSICAPSRAVILTGKYSHLNGVLDNSQSFDANQQTYPKLLQDAGYQTALIGKWHLKSQPTGFDYWNILPGQGAYFDPNMINKEGSVKYKGYVTDIITDQAIDWLNKREQDKPFCLMIHNKAPHANWEFQEKYADWFTGSTIPKPDTFYDDYQTRSQHIKNSQLKVGRNQWQLHYQYRFGDIPKDIEKEDVKPWVYQRFIKDYLRCIASVDENIGRILNYLDASGLSKNTVVIYTSDQGFFLGEHGIYDKRFMYEEALRMPLLIRYPKEIQAGVVSDAIALNLDFSTTILDYGDIPVPPDMQGHSLRKLTGGETIPGWRQSMYYCFYETAFNIGPHEGVRTHRYKLIHHLFQAEAWELFDLNRDPQELYNSYNDPAYSKVVADLKEEMMRLKKKYQVPE